MVFVEWAAFASRRTALLSDGEFRVIRSILIDRPDAGPLIQGTGGCQKIRIARSGAGKRGGARVIYYWTNHLNQIHFLGLYAKSDSEDLSSQEKAVLRSITRALKGGPRQ